MFLNANLKKSEVEDEPTIPRPSCSFFVDLSPVLELWSMLVFLVNSQATESVGNSNHSRLYIRRMTVTETESGECSKPEAEATYSPLATPG